MENQIQTKKTKQGPKGKAKASRPRAISRSKDPTTSYAQKVAYGKIIAGPHVRDACKRHLADLEHGHERGLFWDVEKAKHAIGFFRDVLCLNGGEFEGVPFELLDFQEFIVGSLFGWMDEDGTRRFRVAYVETGKGSGKSPLAAGVGLYGMVADGESRAEVYAAATKKDQAMILFRDAVAMVEQSPELARRIRMSGGKGNESNLAYHETMSYFRPISADDGQSGPRPHMALIDEIHEHKDNRVVEMVRAGTKGRRQALIFMITNSGANRQSICYEYHDYGAKVAKGAIQDDSFFCYICALDEKDDPFHDESCWVKANPALGITIQKKYLREQVREARGMPSKESVVKRLNFCMWVEAANPWLSFDAWQSGKAEYGLEDLAGRRCLAGMDLSSTTDLTALVLLFEPTEEDRRWLLLPYFFLPEENIQERIKKDKVPYDSWANSGFLELTPGRAISKAHILKRMLKISEIVEITSVAYDRWRIEDLIQLAKDNNIDLPELKAFGQGYKDMSPAVDEFETRLLGNQLLHNNNPVMNWCAANAVVVSDPAGNRKVAKDKATGRVDGIVAGVMAVGSSIGTVEEPPKYQLMVV